jgi:hypothetical protein
MSQENPSFPLPIDRHSLVEMLTSSSSNDFAADLEQDSLPIELETIVTSLMDFINAVKAYDSIAPKNATEDEIIKAFAKDPNGLTVLDVIQKVRCNLWSSLIKFFLILLGGVNQPEKAKMVTNANSLKEIANIFIPNANELITPNFIAIKSKLLGKLPTELTENLFGIFKSILACQLAGLPDQANIFADNLIKELITHQESEMVSMREKVLKAIGHIEASSTAGKSGRNKRFEKSDKVKAFAIKLYLEGDFKNPHQASQITVSRIAEYGESIGYRFTSDYQAPRTIETWIRKYEKTARLAVSN